MQRTWGRGAIVLSLLAVAGISAAADWPQWRGPKRDAVCTETGLLEKWPAGGPPLLWKMKGIGMGYSAVAIVGDRLYTMGDLPIPGRRDSRGRQAKRQCILAIDLKTQKPVWTAEVGSGHRDGPRCTPTVDGALTYAIGTSGDIVCVETATGKRVWAKNFGRDFGGKMSTMWRFSESPLVDGDKVICTPGADAAQVVALNKKAGETVWKCAVPDLGRRGRPGAAYASAMVADVDGLRTYVQLVGKGLIGVRASDGKLLWSYNRIANSTANIPTPIVRGNHVFCTTSYGTGAVLLELSRKGDGVDAREVYFLPPNVFENIHGGVVLVGDHLYSMKGHKYNHEPICIEFLTGKVVWKSKSFGRLSCATLYADGHLYYRYEGGTMALVEATPEGYRPKSTWKPQSGGRGPTWAHPVICDGRLYLRHGDELACYDVKAK